MVTNDKYDRQLRLWGAKGQRALGETTVILLRASAAGTETLKNLVLPGVGRIVVIDDDSGLHSTAESNFFLSSSNSSQAQTALEQLQELNPDVQGMYHVVESIEDWIHVASWTSLGDRILVIASDLEPPLLRKVACQCQEKSLPLIVVHAYGLIGSVRLQTPVLPLLEPKPENEPPDLRLVTPFVQFEQLAQSIDWNALDNAQHGHVPYPIILYKVAQDWKRTHYGQLPTTVEEKQDFRQAIQEMSRNWEMEVNFHEAVQNAYLAYSQRTVDTEHLSNLKSDSKKAAPKLHALLVALETFLSRHNQQPPLHGTIPDMTASTILYIQLQQAYHDQAARDVVEMKELVEGAGLDINDEDIQTFCRNVFNLDLLRTRTLEQEYAPILDTDLVDEWNMALMDPYEVPEHTPFLWYVALRACHWFYDKHGRYPGTAIEKYQDDVAPLQECISQVVSSMKLSDNDLVQQTLLDSSCKYAREMVREANAEVHCIASVVGGVASQEAVKIITGQYVPFNNTYIYNGIASTGGVYQV